MLFPRNNDAGMYSKGKRSPLSIVRNGRIGILCIDIQKSRSFTSSALPTPPFLHLHSFKKIRLVDKSTLTYHNNTNWDLIGFFVPGCTLSDNEKLKLKYYIHRIFILIFNGCQKINIIIWYST